MMSACGPPASPKHSRSRPSCPERAELARELVRTLPEDLELEDDESGFSEDWQAEIRRRLRDEPRGEPLTFEQLRERVDKMISHGE
jgi:hypothetical protein